MYVINVELQHRIKGGCFHLFSLTNKMLQKCLFLFTAGVSAIETSHTYPQMHAQTLSLGGFMRMEISVRINYVSSEIGSRLCKQTRRHPSCWKCDFKKTWIVRVVKQSHTHTHTQACSKRVWKKSLVNTTLTQTTRKTQIYVFF